MSPIDRAVVLRKLDIIIDRLEALRPFAEGDLDAYSGDRYETLDDAKVHEAIREAQRLFSGYAAGLKKALDG